MHHYELFGLRFASAFVIPWAPEAAPGEADVTLRRTAPGEAIEADGAVDYNVPGIARYRIGHGREIVVAPHDGASDEDLRLYLLGSALGVLLHQRGLLVLHANAVVIDGAAALFMGPSGAGKSTLAGWFASRGFAVLTDDICAVDVSGEVAVLPGLTRLRLADDAAGNLAIDVSAGAACLSSGKREIGLSRQPSVAAARVRACYLLSDAPAGDGLSVEPLVAMDAVGMLMANTYRGFALRRLGGSAGHLAACMRVTASAPCFDVRRAKDWARFDQDAEALLAHARSQGGILPGVDL